MYCSMTTISPIYENAPDCLIFLILNNHAQLSQMPQKVDVGLQRYFYIQDDIERQQTKDAMEAQ